jgi:membrane-associated phospholipid phosphatase
MPSDQQHRWRRRLLLALLLLIIAFVLDRHAYGLLRAVTLYEHWGEMREGLTTAKFLGSGLGTVMILLSVALIDPRGWRRARVLLLVVLAASGLTAAIKVMSGRERPSHLDQKPGEERISFHGPGKGLRQAPFQSFPSGHTTTAFATATCLASFYPPARALFYTVATANGVNRVVKHQHFLSDVTAAALIGHLLSLWLLGLPWAQRSTGVAVPSLSGTSDASGTDHVR